MQDASSNPKLENVDDDVIRMSCPADMCDSVVSREELDIDRMEEIRATLEEALREAELTSYIGESLIDERGADLAADSPRFVKSAKRIKRLQGRRRRMVAGVVGLFLFPPALAVAILP